MADGNRSDNHGLKLNAATRAASGKIRLFSGNGNSNSPKLSFADAGAEKRCLPPEADRNDGSSSTANVVEATVGMSTKAIRWIRTIPTRSTPRRDWFHRFGIRLRVVKDLDMLEGSTGRW